MTMEELADKWIKQNCCECCVNKDDCDAGTIDCFAKQAFLAGYETMEAYNEKLLNSDIEKHNKIVELEAQIDNLKSIGKTSYIKGIRTMANALKEYDRTEGAWTDYFEHKVDETLKMLLKKGIIKGEL